MAKIHPNQTSFQAGELSPLLQGQSELEGYKQGLSTLKNMYSDSRGPAINRESLKWIIDIVLPAGTTNSRVDTFNRNNNEFFTFIVVHELLYFIRNLDFSTLVSVVAPWTEDQIDDLYIVPLPDGRTFYLLHPNVQPHKLIDNFGVQVVTDFNTDGNWAVPAGITSLDLCVAGGGGGGGGAAIDLGNGGGTGGGGAGVVRETITVIPAEVLNIQVGVGGIGGENNVINNNGGQGKPGQDSVVTYSGPTITGPGAIGGASGVHSTAEIFGQGSAGGGNGGEGGKSDLSIQDPQVGGDTFARCSGSIFKGGEVDISAILNGGGGGAGGFGRGGPGNVFQANVAPGIAPPTGGGGGSSGEPPVNALGYMSQQGGPGRVRISYTSVQTTIDLTPVTFTGAPSEWTDDNWPSCGTYFQSRLWLASTPEQPETFLGSVPGSPEDFTTGITASDALSFIMENFGPIEWMVNAKDLLIGTTNGEYQVTSVDGVITSSDISVLQQSSYGSASIQPLKLGDQVIYVTPDRRKVRAMNYEERKTNWMSVDLTLPSEHLTEAGIKNISWAQHPHNLLWVNLTDGKMACLSYERGDNIYGWHRHETAGVILSSDVGFDSERSVSVMLVSRRTGVISVEALSPIHYFDSWKEASVFTPFTNINGDDFYYIDGFDHLDNRIVQIVLNDVYYGDRLVGDASDPLADTPDKVPGRIYLDDTGTLAIVGLRYDAVLATLPFDEGAATGSGISLMKHRNKIFVRVLDSGLPLINDARDPNPLPDTLISTTLEEFNLGYDRDSIVKVSQDLPLPLKVLAIFGEMKRNSL